MFLRTLLAYCSKCGQMMKYNLVRVVPPDLSGLYRCRECSNEIYVGGTHHER